MTTGVDAPETAESPAATEGVGVRRQPAESALRRLLDAGWLSVVVGLALWEVLPRGGVLPADYIPPATVVLPEFVSLLGDGTFWADVQSTLAGYATGLAISILTAIPLGLIIGTNAYLFRATRAIVEFLRPIPSVALIPLAILVYGINFEMKVFLVTFATFWPLLIQSICGVQDVDPVARDTAGSFGFSRVEIFFRVTLPSAAVYIATGLRLASALAMILAITAELVAGVNGLGKSILLAQSAGANATMYALIFAVGLLSSGLSYLIRGGERYVLRWHPSYREPVK